MNGRMGDWTTKEAGFLSFIRFCMSQRNQRVNSINGRSRDQHSLLRSDSKKPSDDV